MDDSTADPSLPPRTRYEGASFLREGEFAGKQDAEPPDDSPLLLRDAGTYDVYALDWQAP